MKERKDEIDDQQTDRNGDQTSLEFLHQDQPIPVVQWKNISTKQAIQQARECFFDIHSYVHPDEWTLGLRRSLVRIQVAWIVHDSMNL